MKKGTSFTVEFEPHTKPLVMRTPHRNSSILPLHTNGSLLVLVLVLVDVVVLVVVVDKTVVVGLLDN